MLAATLTILLVILAMVYLRGWWQLRMSRWPAASFFLGLLSIWLAVASPVSTLDERMLTAHMVQHLLLMTIAPPLIWLGNVAQALLPAVSRLVSTRFGRALESGLTHRVATHLGHLLAHPAFCWLSAAAALVVWHVPALLRLGMESPTWHLLEHASFLATGLLFWWPVVQPWPSVARWPRWSMIVYLFLATLPCDVLSGLLVFSDRIAYPMYLCAPHHSSLSVLDDQQCAGALMWTCVTVVFLVAGVVLSTQLLSPQTAPGDAEAVRI